MSKKNFFNALLGSCALLAWSASAGAQPTEQPSQNDENSGPASDPTAGQSSPTDGSSGESSTFDVSASSDQGDITVTAQRRSERLQDVPIAVTAFSGETLRNMDVSKPQDVFAQTPSVRFQAPAGVAGFPIYVIRGVAMLDFSYSSESSVVSYRDEVYQGNPALGATPLFDLERVEVLRGPQGTLWGRNATGGLIHFISAQPTRDFEAGMKLQYGTYRDVVTEGFVSGPISENVRARVAGRYNSNDGYQTDAVNGRDLAKVDHAFDVRGILAFDLTEDLNLTVNAHFTDASGQNNVRPFKGLRQPSNPALACDITQIRANACVNGSGYSNPTFTPEIAYSGEDLAFSRHGWGASARFEWDFGGATLTSLTAYEELRKFEAVDIDGAPIGRSPVRFLQFFDIDHEQVSQELRLSGNSDRLQWQVGAFYYHDNRFYTSTLPFVPAGNWTDQSISSISGFGQATYAVTDTVNVTAGARYTKDDKDITLAGISAGGVRGTRLGTQTFLLESETAPDAVTWRLGADWHVTPDVMLFASAATGYKLGGFNTTGQFSAATAGPVDPEKTLSYEIGIKSALFDRRLTANLTLFHTLWEDIQASATVVIPGAPVVGTAYTNIGDAKIYGAEAELAFRPTSDLSLSLGGSLNDNELDAPGIVIGGRPIDGNVLANTPEVMVYGAINWEPSLGSSGKLLFGATANHQSRVFFRPDNLPFADQPAYTLVNGRIGWSNLSESIRVEFFGNNIFNKKYFESSTSTGDAAVYTWGLQRTYGVRLTGRF